eukprot:403350233
MSQQGSQYNMPNPLIKHNQIFYFRVPTQMRYIFENPENLNNQDCLGEVLIKQSDPSVAPEMFVTLLKRRKVDNQDSGSYGSKNSSTKTEQLSFKCQDISDKNAIRYIMKAQDSGVTREQQNMKSSSSHNKRLNKAKLKGRLTKTLQMIPQQKIDVIEIKQDTVSIESIDKPPEVFLQQSVFDIRQKQGTGQPGQETILSGAAASQRQQPKEKRFAMDQGDLKMEIFGLFQKYYQYTLEDIQNILNQPRDPVKKVLEEICELNRNTRFYELKRSYT